MCSSECEQGFVVPLLYGGRFIQERDPHAVLGSARKPIIFSVAHIIVKVNLCP